MKNYFILALVATAIFSSCSMEKRVYSRGVQIDFLSLTRGKNQTAEYKKNVGGEKKQALATQSANERRPEFSEIKENAKAGFTSTTVGDAMNLLEQCNTSPASISTPTRGVSSTVSTYTSTWTNISPKPVLLNLSRIAADSSIAPKNVKDGHKSANWGLFLVLLGIAALAVGGTFIITPVGYVLSIIGKQKTEKGSKYYKRANAGTILGFLTILLDLIVLLLLFQYGIL